MQEPPAPADAQQRTPDDASSQANWKRIYIATAVFLIAIEALLVYYGSALTMPLVLLILLIVFARPGQKLRFVRDFGPFLLILFAYYAMWGSADDVRGAIHITPQIDAERFLFGGRIPTIVLQDALYDPNNPQWYDYAVVIGHLSHFVLPILFAGIVWQHYHQLHMRFMFSFVLLSYGAFLTFMLFPSAPPWWAAEHGYIDNVYLVHETVPGLARVYGASANPVAAIPSLHAAWPWFLFLFSIKIWGKRALPVIIYPVFIWWSIVYSGHHYVVDAIAGVAYASLTYYALSGHPYDTMVRAFRRIRPQRTGGTPEGAAPQPAVSSTAR